jgi:hypothetical protein
MTEINKTPKPNRTIRAENLVRETKVLNIARLAKMLVDLFGLDEPFTQVGKREGQEIEMYLKEYPQPTRECQKSLHKAFGKELFDFFVFEVLRIGL